jgi:hypothetical protein
MSRINVGDHVRLVKDENLPGPRRRVGATDSCAVWTETWSATTGMIAAAAACLKLRALRKSHCNERPWKRGGAARHYAHRPRSAG